MGNEESIRYAIDEVIGNSVRELLVRDVASPVIVLRSERSGNEIWLSVTDNGLPETAKLIDDPFAECETTYEQSGRGTGLGLTIVRETFRSHGGDCSLEANFDGDERIPGTKFVGHFVAASYSDRKDQS